MSNVHIFGATGFIGTHLSSYLIKNGSNVVAQGIREGMPNLSLDTATVFINLIGKAHDHSGNSTKEDFYYANLELTKKVFRLFQSSKAHLFIQISSIAAVEEFQSTTPLGEDEKCRPDSWYGKSKREAEEWLLNQPIAEDKKVLILRPPMVYGPGDKGNLSVLYKFISKGYPYPLASFNNRRTFISINNFNYFIFKILTNTHSIKDGIYHIADDQSISTSEIISIIKRVSKKNIPNIALPSLLVKVIARIGDFIPIPLNSKRLKKMTGDFLVSNEKVKIALSISDLPDSTEKCLEETFDSMSCVIDRKTRI
ncbi:NAD-dependent epimerase/dehydratase family protein [Sphingobacterium sp. DK4209]|uniref:NAD-dependent epimerase/dehydratase family protein n=1 Tax=Sphingobacterium zhuxiongii TaxID=2662364 RepID=A0A5Q0QDQ5_9SPHI|nr:MULTISPECIES: NAD-dependent epimerase/dehydratase family protein [unclassified Sphingobacterium]MVZ65758.1 NAD-dependent epimerase/dehydratase family protein [Sphingobacterium sp. DK4209]QGA27955.1 NAD-dependent epimerase/dehydratase family protein [Sphingobacterium sp. dk4302]